MLWDQKGLRQKFISFFQDLQNKKNQDAKKFFWKKNFCLEDKFFDQTQSIFDHIYYTI